MIFSTKKAISVKFVSRAKLLALKVIFMFWSNKWVNFHLVSWPGQTNSPGHETAGRPADPQGNSHFYYNCRFLTKNVCLLISFSDEKLSLVDYSSSHEGLLQSWRERWSAEEAKEIDSYLADMTKRDEKHFLC